MSPGGNHSIGTAPGRTRGKSARLFVSRVDPLELAVLLHFQPLTIVDLVLHRDVVAVFAARAFEGDFHPFFALSHGLRQLTSGSW
jgi:hypothetical protein